MYTISRIECPQCGTPCIEQEIICWQCATPLRPPELEPSAVEEPANGSASITTDLIHFDDGASRPAPSAPHVAMTLTGEMVEVPEPAPTAPVDDKTQLIAANIGDTTISAGPPVEVIRLTFCKVCGQENEEGAVECRKCKTPLEIVAVDSLREIAPLPRAWGFDVLGAVWCLLGFAAIYCGQFLIKADPAHPGTTWADYFWTGIVVCAPGILIFMRHYFCKILFWVMTLGSLLVWSVIGFLWLFIGVHVSPNGEVGLTWLALLSALSVVSYFTVRQNDAFDFGL